MSWLTDLFGVSGQQQALNQISQQQQNIAGQQNKYGQALEKPLQTGTLPAPAQALVNEILQANLANYGNTFARLGLSDSTMGASAQNQARQESLAQTFGIEEDMAKLGLQAVQEALGGLSGAAGSQMDIANLTLGTDKILADTIGSFAKALGMAASPTKPGATSG